MRTRHTFISERDSCCECRCCFALVRTHVDSSLSSHLEALELWEFLLHVRNTVCRKQRICPEENAKLKRWTTRSVPGWAGWRRVNRADKFLRGR